MGAFPRVLLDEAHSNAWSIDADVAARINPAQPADASYAQAAADLRRLGFQVRAHRDGPFTPALLDGVDVVVIAHPALPGTDRSSGHGCPVLTGQELAALVAFVQDGGGLVVIAECDQDRYGNNLNELLARFGLGVDSLTCHDGVHRHNNVSAWVLADFGAGAGRGILARVDQACFYRAGALRITPATPGVQVLARTHPTAHPAGAPLAATATHGRGRVVVFTDSDLFGDDSIEELDHRALWANTITWAAGTGRGPRVPPPGAHLAEDPRWLRLKAAVDQVRRLQAHDGSVTDAAAAAPLVQTIVQAIGDLAPLFPHDGAYLQAVQADLRGWAAGGFTVPDFLDCLRLFRPDLGRVDGRVHLVVFAMYTQNGNPDRNLEAVLCSVLWPPWLAQVEQVYDNPGFVSLNLLDFTAGYDTNSAVLFPETVAVRQRPDFTWGAIFADREAARFRRVVGAAVDVLGVDLPPDAARLLGDQGLCQHVFALWDLIHDRTHGRGALPFDPFMIKQRMPFWVYALEELRCDLTTFRQMVHLHAQGQPYARSVQDAIVFDRILRFTITGDRVRNYDGLAGQLLFAHLHTTGVLEWVDNTLSLDWRRLPGAVLALADEVDGLYRAGVDRSRLGQWIASYDLVARYVPPHPRSAWAAGPATLPVDATARDLLDLVLADEFPLSVFFEALRTRLAPVVASTRGIRADTHDKDRHNRTDTPGG